MTPVSTEPTALVRRATGLLEQFNRAGVLGYADVHVALRLRRLLGESDESVLLAVALAVRGVHHGSVCVAVADLSRSTAVEALSAEEVSALPWPPAAEWLGAIEASRLVAAGYDGPAERPLRLVDGLLYLDRYWRQERLVAGYVDAAMAAGPMSPDRERLSAALGRLFHGPAPNPQRLAAVVAAYRRFGIIAGGPGTGKTTTLARLLALLQDQPGPPLRVALAAPTGKAAARMSEAAEGAAQDLDQQDRDRLGPLNAVTLHRLLGRSRNQRTRFWHDRNNRLPYDVVVVDEASMVSLTLMARLIEALHPDARLVLVGDPNQLSSVEVGAVLNDLVHRTPPPGAAPADEVASLVPRDLDALGDAERQRALTAGVVELTENHRAAPELQDLAEAIRTGSIERLGAVLDAGHDRIEFVDADPASGWSSDAFRHDVLAAGTVLVEAARAGDAEAALTALDRHRVLCGHREGPYGVARWAAQIEGWITEGCPGYASDGQWYLGRPLLVTSNDYQLRLFNGDTGVVVDHEGQPQAAFRREGAVELFAPGRLADVQTVHAMSVHRSQGSEFDRVTVVLPPSESPLLSRELIYTAVTRAKHHVRIIGTRAALERAVDRPVRRASGLRSVRPYAPRSS